MGTVTSFALSPALASAVLFVAEEYYVVRNCTTMEAPEQKEFASLVMASMNVLPDHRLSRDVEYADVRAEIVRDQAA